MQAIQKTLFKKAFPIASVGGQRTFAVTQGELFIMDQRVRRKLNSLRVMTDDSEFTYEPPQMIYDKKTGDVTIIDTSEAKRSGKTKIRNMDDLMKEKKAVAAELGITDGDLFKHDVKSNINDVAQKIFELEKRADETFDIDPKNFYSFSRDMFRIDVGLIIMRVPIFMHMRDADIELMKLRSEIMNEYFCDFKKYIKEYASVTELNESIYSENPYASKMNLDNYPTHEWTNPETGETESYCAASKNFAKVDPECTDWRSMHYAPEDRTYFLVRNKYTHDW